VVSVDFVFSFLSFSRRVICAVLMFFFTAEKKEEASYVTLPKSRLTSFSAEDTIPLTDSEEISRKNPAMKIRMPVYSDSVDRHSTSSLSKEAKVSDRASSLRRKSSHKAFLTTQKSSTLVVFSAHISFVILLSSELLTGAFSEYCDGLNDTQKSIFVNENLPILASIKFAVSKMVEYLSFGHPIPTGCVTANMHSFA
jgi:hypothetical protein